MRDPNRIDEIIDELRKCWKRNPDLRLGQLIYFLNKSDQEDIFYIEDDSWLRWIKANM
jgi:uncharacterized protein YihD (DUF1040 family)